MLISCGVIWYIWNWYNAWQIKLRLFGEFGCYEILSIISWVCGREGGRETQEGGDMGIYVYV